MKLNYVLVGTPDKISLNTFLRFLRKSIGKDYIIGEMHSLMSEKDKESYVTDFVSKKSKGIFSYFAKGVKKAPDPIKVLPSKAYELSDVVVWFDLYSTIPIAIKDKDGFLKDIFNNWNKFIESMNF